MSGAKSSIMRVSVSRSVSEPTTPPTPPSIMLIFANFLSCGVEVERANLVVLITRRCSGGFCLV